MDYITNKKNPLKKYKYSICTPCFNSEKTIREVHRSLEKITYKNFEWIVINDNSSDATGLILEEILESTEIDMRLYTLESNKMVTYCYNFGVQKARGEFFLLLDHDDEFMPEIFDRFNHHWELIPHKQKENIAGMMCTCVDQFGDLVGNEFPNSPCVDGFFEMIFDRGVRHEKLFCYKTDIMKRFNFPVVDRYVPESTVLWNISSEYKTYFFNESLRTYTKPEVQNKNLSFLSSMDYPIGFRLNYINLINFHTEKLYTRPRILVSFLLNYLFFSKKADVSFLNSFLEIKSNILRCFLAVLYFPLSVLIYFNIKTR